MKPHLHRSHHHFDLLFIFGLFFYLLDRIWWRLGRHPFAWYLSWFDSDYRFVLLYHSFNIAPPHPLKHLVKIIAQLLLKEILFTVCNFLCEHICLAWGTVPKLSMHWVFSLLVIYKMTVVPLWSRPVSFVLNFRLTMVRRSVEIVEVFESLYELYLPWVKLSLLLLFGSQQFENILHYLVQRLFIMLLIVNVYKLFLSIFKLDWLGVSEAR